MQTSFDVSVRGFDRTINATQAYEDAVDAVCDPFLEMVPYLMRHSGASIDRATDVRDQVETTKRGRWAAARSVRRYEKRGRLNETWRTLSTAQQAYCEACARNLERIVLFGDAGPPRP